MISALYIDSDGKTKRTKIDLVVFEARKPHDADGLIRVCIVNDDKTKAKDSKKGVEATLQTILDSSENCEFGLWTNGDEFHFLQRRLYGPERFPVLLGHRRGWRVRRCWRHRCPDSTSRSRDR